jgi:phosphoserine phosphatase
LKLPFKNLVNQHKQKNNLVFNISNNLSNICVPIYGEFGIRDCFSTHLLVRDSRYSGLWEGSIFEGETKFELVKQLANTYDLDLSSSYAYADSYTDRRMLDAVGFPIAVNPDRRLRKYARLKRWKIMAF